MIVILILVVFIVFFCITSRDYFGQDASMRASAGWVSGPMYGYDPISEFAQQIKELEESERFSCL